tara:strand:+ start:306 stop:566 length:261 start_codon:yes stop_codon:yes gene_type:complete
MKQATVFNIIKALSFHTIATYNHPAQPTNDMQVSRKGLTAEARITIATNNVIDAIHFTYQSLVCFGVADLNILLLFRISSVVNFVI